MASPQDVTLFDIYEKLGRLGSDWQRAASDITEMKERLADAEETQSEHRRRLYDRLDSLSSRVTDVESVQARTIPELKAVKDFVDKAVIMQAKVDGRKELIITSMSVGAKLWEFAKLPLMWLGFALLAFWRELVTFISSRPHP